MHLTPQFRTTQVCGTTFISSSDLHRQARTPYQLDSPHSLHMVFGLELILLINNRLLLFPARLCVWYCLEGHDSLLAVCCMHPSLLRALVTFQRLVYTGGSFLYPHKLISRPHTYSCLGTGYKRHRAAYRGVYDSPKWRGTSWNLLSTEQFVKERKDNLYKYYIINFLKSQIFCGSRER